MESGNFAEYATEAFRHRDAHVPTWPAQPVPVTQPSIALIVMFKFSQPLTVSYQRIKPLRSPVRPRLILTSVASLLPTLVLGADATKTWDLLKNDGSATANANFYNLENWDLDQRPTFTDNTDSILFTGAGAGTISLNVAGGLTEFLVKSFTFTGGAYTFNGAQNLTFGDATNSPNNTGNLTNNSTSTQVFNPSSTIAFRSGTINAAAGGITFNANPTINVGANSNVAGRNVTVDGAFNVTINSTLAGTGTDLSDGGSLIKNGTGTLFLQGDSSTWGGRLTINSGSVEINKGFALGSNDGRTTIAGGASTGRLNIKGGINVSENLYLEGRASAASPHLVNLSGSNTIASAIRLASGGTNYGIESTAGSLTIGGDIAYANASVTSLRLGGAGNGVINGNIGGTGSAINVVKDGGGTWSLNGIDGYTGSTTISAGRLNLTTAHTGNGAITINDGATLGVRVTGAGQTLSSTSLTLGGTTGGSLDFETGAFGNPTAPIIIADAFSTADTSVISIKSTAAPLSIGQFTLVDYNGAIGGSGFAGLTLGALPARVAANLAEDTVNSRLVLNVTAFDVPKWTGANGTAWDIDDGTGTGTLNWQEANSGLATRYLQGSAGTDSVIFDDSAVPSAASINLTTTLTPAAVTVSNSTIDYTFTGAGHLSGATSLQKQGSGTLILTNTSANDYTGTTTISAGTLQIGDNVTIGGGSIGTGNVITDGTFLLNRPDAYTVGAAIGGSGTIVKQGSGTATLNGNNSFAGAVTVATGTLKLGNSNALGSTAAGTTIQSGATLDVNGRVTPAGEIVTVSGTGVLDGGAIINTGTGGAGVGVKNVVFAGPTTFGGSVRFDLRDNPGGLNAVGFTLTKIGASTIFLANLGETHLGNTAINSGRLTLEGNTTLGDQSGAVTISNAAELGLEDSTVIHSKSIQLNGGIIVATSGTLNELAGPITLEADSNVRSNTSTTLKISGDINGTANLTKGNAGVLILSGNNTYVGQTTVTQGTLRVGDDGPTGSLGNGPVSLEPASGQTATLAFRRSDSALVVSNVISSPGGGTASAGTNVLNIGANNGTVPSSAIVTIASENTFNGAVNINGGSLRITNSHALGEGAKTLSIASNGKPSLRLDGSSANLQLSSDISLLTSNDDATYPAVVNEAGNNSINGTISPTNASGGNTRIRVGSGTLSLNGAISPAAAATSGRVLILDGPGNGTVNGLISSGAQSLGVTKAGTGTWILNAANPYTANTSIQAGTLKLGAGGSISSSPVISLATGSTFDVSSVDGFSLGSDQTLSGSGTVQGSVTVSPSSLISSPGAPVNALTFTNNLILAGGGIRAGVATGGVAPINVGGNLSVNANTSVEITSNGAALSGSYRLIDYAGSLGGNPNDFTLSNSTRYALAIDTSTPNQVKVSASGSAANLIWSGDGGANVWNVKSSANWNAGTEKFYNADSVSFGDASQNTAVTISEIVSPNSVTIGGSQNYTFVGSGGISGAPGGLTKAGSGTLTVITANSYIGPTLVTEGSLLVNGSISGSLVTVEDGGTLGGSGTIDSNNQPLVVASGGHLSPGVSTGNLTLDLGASSLDLSAALGGAPSLVFDLGSVTNSDAITLTSGTLNVGTGLLSYDDFAFTSQSGFGIGTYTLFATNNLITGTLTADIGQLTGVIAGLPASIGLADNGTDIVLAVVPEPASLASLMAGLGMIAGFHRRRNS